MHFVQSIYTVPTPPVLCPGQQWFGRQFTEKIHFFSWTSLDVKGSQFRAIDHRIRKKQLVPGR